MAKKKNNSFLQKAAPVLLCVVILIVFIVIRTVVVGIFHNRTASVVARVQELTNQIESTMVNTQVAQSTVKETVTGLDTVRVATDDELAAKMFEEILNWSDQASYESCREAAKTNYGMTEDGSFLGTFMVEALEITSDDGTTYNMFDNPEMFGVQAGVNSSYAGMKSHVVRIDGTNYSYLTEVAMLTKAPNGGSGTMNAVFSYTVDGDGKITNVEAFGLQQ